jgi:hypothetical protein
MSIEEDVKVQVKVIPCRHCNSEGTFRSGENGNSCEVCVRKNLKWTLAFCFSKPRYGMVCSVCKGIGEIEPFTERLHNRIVPALAIVLVYFALALVWFMAFLENQYFSEILAFSSTLIGSITGYYFGGKNK